MVAELEKIIAESGNIVFFGGVMMKEAVTAGATIMALAHNHPSGSPAPSRADDELTRKVKQACDIMRIFFMDHVIVTDGNFYSYHDKGKL